MLRCPAVAILKILLPWSISAKGTAVCAVDFAQYVELFLDVPDPVPNPFSNPFPDPFPDPFPNIFPDPFTDPFPNPFPDPFTDPLPAANSNVSFEF